MMKVATLVDYVVAGGAERAAVEIASRLGSDVESIFISSRLSHEAVHENKYSQTIRDLEAAGVRFVAGNRTGTARVWEWRPVLSLLRRARVDVLHTHLWGSNFWGPGLARAAGIPVLVAHEQTPFERTGGARKWGRQIVVNRFVAGPFSSAVIVPSEWSKRALVAHEGVRADKIHVVPNGARPRPVGSRDRRTVRSEFGVGNEEPVAIVAAMLRPEKAHEVVIRALERLTGRWPKIQLWIAGAGPTESPVGTGDMLEALSSALGLSQRVKFLGHRGDVADLVAAADVAILSSHHENLPLAVLEYMESGTPIVATEVGGVPELIHHEVHGLLVPRGDAEAMANAIARTLDDPGAAARRASAALERRRTEFDWAPIARRVRALYAQLLSDPRRG